MRVDQQHAEVAQHAMARQQQQPADAVALPSGPVITSSASAISSALRAIGPATAKPSPAEGNAGCLGKGTPGGLSGGAAAALAAGYVALEAGSDIGGGSRLSMEDVHERGNK